MTTQFQLIATNRDAHGASEDVVIAIIRPLAATDEARQKIAAGIAEWCTKANLADMKADGECLTFRVAPAYIR